MTKMANTHPPPALTILFQDDHLFVINKPSWWVVHRGLARDKIVLADVVKSHLGADTVYPVHRLDRQTSGVLMFALHPEAARMLQGQFADGKIKKKYVALVRGVAPPEGHIDSPVPKKEGGERVFAQTDFVRIATAETTPRATSLVLVKPRTGRFHQIRRHLKHINHPIIGDANYGKGKLNRAFQDHYELHRMALHATSIKFCHPENHTRICIRAPLPKDLTGPLTTMGFDTTTL